MQYHFDDELAAYVDRSFDFVLPEVVDDTYRKSFDDELDGFYQRLFAGKEAEYAVGKIEDRMIDVDGAQIQIRIYTPEGAAEKMPCMMMYHGGGYITGSIKGLDYFSRYVSRHAGRVVVSVAYRLAPQVHLSVALGDCYAALNYVYSHPDTFGIDANKIAVCGDSAGGSAATIIAMMAAKNGIPVEKQALVYPWVDMRSADTPSRRRYGKGYSLDTAQLDKTALLCVNDARELSKPEFSPLLADDEAMKSMPQTFIVMAACCPLTSDCMAYADRLKENGVDVKARIYHNMPHSFIIFNYPETYAALDDICAFLMSR